MKPKILWIIKNAGFVGGAERVVFEIAKGLQNTFESSLLYGQAFQESSSLYFNPFHSCNRVDFDRNTPTVYEETKKILQSISPQIIYLHKCLSPAIFQALLDSKIPVLHNVHDHEIYCLRGSKTYPFSRKICSRKAPYCCLFPGCAFLARDPSTHSLRLRWPQFFKHQTLLKQDRQLHYHIVPSSYMKKTLEIQGYDPQKIEIIYPIPALLPQENFQNNFSKENHIVFIGQLVRGKGLDCLIQSLKYLDIPFQLHVIGQGPELSSCRALSKQLGLEDKILFKGYVPNDQFSNILSQCTLGVVPSVWPEPFSLVGPELMLNGLPVVAFNNGAISEWLQDNDTGFLVPHLDLIGLAKKISLLLLDKKKAQEMGQAGRLYALKHYSQSTLLQKHKEVIQRFLS